MDLNYKYDSSENAQTANSGIVDLNSGKIEQFKRYMFFSRYANIGRNRNCAPAIDPFFWVILEQWYIDGKKKSDIFKNVTLDDKTYTAFEIDKY